MREDNGLGTRPKLQGSVSGTGVTVVEFFGEKGPVCVLGIRTEKR